jgi:glycosyltransferase involved in cell wall biosynthesis
MSLHVVASSPSLDLSGANVLVANLLDQLQRAGLQTEWIVTGHNPTDDATWLGARQFEIHRLRLTRISDVQQRQKMLAEFLEERAPCIYLPNFDFDMACAAPALSPSSKVVLIMHCDDPVYHDFAARHGNLFHAIVCVSKFLAETLGAALPELQGRIFHIPFGVAPPAGLPVREKLPGQLLEAAYCGRISFHQKRVQDLAQIINRCHAENLPVRFQIAGTGPDEKTFFESVKAPLAAGKVSRRGFLPNPEVLKLLNKSDVLLMTSDFEGLPVVLLEAMSRGCVPVVTKIESGMGELVQHGENGFLLPVGDVKSFVEVLAKISADSALLSRLHLAAFDRITSGGFTLERAAADYRKLFESLAGAKWQVKRDGRTITPEHYRLGSRIIKRFQTLFGLQRP